MDPGQIDRRDITEPAFMCMTLGARGHDVERRQSILGKARLSESSSILMREGPRRASGHAEIMGKN
jgi:hypothetical protein